MTYLGRSVRQDVDCLIKNYLRHQSQTSANYQIGASYLTPSENPQSDVIFIAAYLEAAMVGCICIKFGPNNRVSQLLPQQLIDTPEMSRLIVCSQLGELTAPLRQALIVEACKLALEYQHNDLVALVSLPLYELLSQEHSVLTRLYETPVFEEGRLQYAVSFQATRAIEFCGKAMHLPVSLKRVQPVRRFSL